MTRPKRPGSSRSSRSSPSRRRAPNDRRELDGGEATPAGRETWCSTSLAPELALAAVVHRADVERARRLASSSTPANRVRATPTRGSGRVVWSWSELTLCVLSARARSTRVCCRAAAPSSRIAVFRRAVAARLQAARCPLPPLAPTAAPPALAPPTASSDSLSRSRAPAHLAARVLHHARHYSRIIGAVAHLAVCGEDRLWAVSKRGGTAARPSLSGTLSLAAITHVCRMPSTNEFSFHTRHVWSWGCRVVCGCRPRQVWGGRHHTTPTCLD